MHLTYIAFSGMHDHEMHTNIRLSIPNPLDLAPELEHLDEAWYLGLILFGALAFPFKLTQPLLILPTHSLMLSSQQGAAHAGACQAMHSSCALARPQVSEQCMLLFSCSHVKLPETDAVM